MAYKKPYQPYSFDQSDRKTLTITNFGGVDLSSQKFNVSSARAIQSLNFVYRDGMIQKRFGYEQIYQLKGDSTNFNGIWSFIGEDKKTHVIAHVGSKLYEVTNINSENIEFKVFKEECNELLDKKSFAFTSGNKLWILGGIHYLCVRFSEDENKNLMKVEEMKECYVPTTTSSIIESYVSLNSVEGTRRTDQPVNLLTKWRKNACITGLGREPSQTYAPRCFIYELDAPIIFEDVSDMKKFTITVEKIGD